VLPSPAARTADDADFPLPRSRVRRDGSATGAAPSTRSNCSIDPARCVRKDL